MKVKIIKRAGGEKVTAAIPAASSQSKKDESRRAMTATVNSRLTN